jgi:hypothetical protein
MANPTTNYGFVLPTPTDLVTDLPADFDVALQGVDTRLKALQPGTTLGDLAYSSATANTNTRLGVGSTGNVLTVAGGVPTWAAPAGGGSYTLISTTNAATSSNVDLTSIPQTYQDLMIIVSDFYFNVAKTANIKCNTTTPSLGATWYNNAGTFGTQSGGALSLSQYEDVDANDNNNMTWIYISDYTTAFPKKRINVQSVYVKNYGGVTQVNSFYNYYFNDTTAISRVQIDVAGTDTFTQGTVYLYGVK